MRPEDLVFEPPDFRPPLPAGSIKNAPCLFGIQQYGAGVPAILHGQSVNFTEDAGTARLGKAVERNNANMLRANLRLDASGEIVRGQHFVQISRYLWKRERVIVTRNAAADVP